MTTVAELAVEMFGVSLEPAVARSADDGLADDESIESGCPECSRELHALSKPYTSGGKQYRYAGFVCAECVRTFTLQDLGYTSRKAMDRAVMKATGHTETHGAGHGSSVDLPWQSTPPQASSTSATSSALTQPVGGGDQARSELLGEWTELQITGRSENPLIARRPLGIEYEDGMCEPVALVSHQLRFLEQNADVLCKSGAHVRQF